MADCNDLFHKFLNSIRLSREKENFLIQAKQTEERFITSYFKSKGIKPPIYKDQGSYAMNTMIDPARDRFDVDHGIHLQHLSSNRGDWPEPEKVHQMIYDAVKNAEGRSKPPKRFSDKPKCVRVEFDDYHVDLPIFAHVNGRCYLAAKTHKQYQSEWTLSDPSALTEWFRIKAKSDQQLLHIVQYLKVWSIQSSVPLKGIMLAILVANNFRPDQREDKSFSLTSRRILDVFSQKSRILNPVDSNHNLTKDWKTGTMKHTIQQLERLCQLSEKAIAAPDKTEAIKHWGSLFGKRFPS